MTCPVCGEKAIPGLVCCDLLMDELDEVSRLEGDPP